MRTTTSSTTEPIDVLIIGSGPAGSTYARTIGDRLPDARILMVEVGPAIPGARGEHSQNMSSEARATAQRLTQGPDTGLERSAALADIAPGMDPSLEFRQTILPGLFFVDPRPALEDGEVGLPAASMASGVGGMGIHWGTSSPRPRGSERIPFIPEAEMDAALDEAERLLHTRTPRVPGGGLPEALRAAVGDTLDGPGLAPAQFMPTSTQVRDGRVVFSGTGRILGDLERDVPGFELRTETLAKRILLDGARAVGAVLQDRRAGAGEVYEVRARQVVVCADGLRTPQLLFASGIRPAALGRHLNEHFQVATFLSLSEEFAPDGFAASTSDATSVVVPFSDARPMQTGVIALANSAFKISLGDGEEEQADPASRLAVVACYGRKDLSADDAVEFSETDTDFYGMPRMRIRYHRTPTDVEQIERMLAVSALVAARLGEPSGPPELAAGGSSLHYQGTVRCGAIDDGTSVCDDRLRVWGVEGLHLGGNGVIPTATACNPTLTTVALAHRAAEAVAEALLTTREPTMQRSRRVT